MYQISLFNNDNVRRNNNRTFLAYAQSFQCHLATNTREKNIGAAPSYGYVRLCVYKHTNIIYATNSNDPILT